MEIKGIFNLFLKGFMSSEESYYLESTLYSKDGRESVIEVLEHQVAGMILLDGIFGSQGHTTQHYHKHNEAVEERFRDKPMDAHPNAATENH